MGVDDGQGLHRIAPAAVTGSGVPVYRPRVLMYEGDVSLSGPRERRPYTRMPWAVDALDAGGIQGLTVSTMSPA